MNTCINQFSLPSALAMMDAAERLGVTGPILVAGISAATLIEGVGCNSVDVEGPRKSIRYEIFIEL